MDNVIICPDIHCRDFWKPVLDIKDKPIVFLGDYLDPYAFDGEGYYFLEGLDYLEEIIKFKKDNPERVTLLWGNHDFNSLWQINWASRFRPSIRAHKLFVENFNLFEPYKVIDDVLFTHAGVCEGWYNTHSIKDIIHFLDVQWDEFVKYFSEESYLAIFDCGRDRGGYAPHGGIFWHDAHTMYRTNPIDYVQIYGHTQLTITGSILKDPWPKGKPMYCCDSRAIFEYTNNELKLYGNN